MANSHNLTGLSSGFSDLDRWIDGFKPGQLIVVGAAPGSGKTSFLLNLAYNIASTKSTPFVFYSMELDAEECAARMLSLGSMGSYPNTRFTTGVNYYRGNCNHLGDWEWQQLGNAYDMLCGTPMYINSSYPIDVETISVTARRLKETRGIKLILIDYLQLLSGNFSSVKHHMQIRPIANRLKQLAEELHISVVIASQLNRSCMLNPSSKPKLTSIRGRTAITDYADIVLLIHRFPTQHVKHSTTDDRCENRMREISLVIVKNPHGATGSIQMWFLPEIKRFLPVCAIDA